MGEKAILLIFYIMLKNSAELQRSFYSVISCYMKNPVTKAAAAAASATTIKGHFK